MLTIKHGYGCSTIKIKESSDGSVAVKNSLFSLSLIMLPTLLSTDTGLDYLCCSQCYFSRKYIKRSRDQFLIYRYCYNSPADC